MTLKQKPGGRISERRKVEMPELKEGLKAPDFSSAASGGENVSLKSFRGRKNVVLYFYPKDDTPGCTVEACGFRDSIKIIESQDTVILGVSPDGVAAHEKFIKKFSLPFILLADEQKKICQDYGVWVQKSLYGRKYMGVERTTFVIDKEGKIAKIFTKVRPQGHNDEVLAALQGINH